MVDGNKTTENNDRSVLNGNKKFVVGGSILGIPIVAIIAFCLRITSAATNQAAVVKNVSDTVFNDHEPRIRYVEKSVTTQDARHAELMRVLKEIKEELKEQRRLVAQ